MAALLVVSDELSELKWRSGVFQHSRLKKRSRVAADHCLLEVHKHLGLAEMTSGDNHKMNLNNGILAIDVGSGTQDILVWRP